MTKRERSSAYSAKLRDPRWQKKRLSILERDDFACQSCFDTESTLHVHHQYYTGGDPWDIPNEALITLCEECHEDEGQIGAEERQTFVRVFQHHGWLAGEFNAVLVDVHEGGPLHFMPGVEARMIGCAFRIPEVKKALVDAYWAYLKSRRQAAEIARLKAEQEAETERIRIEQEHIDAAAKAQAEADAARSEADRFTDFLDELQEVLSSHEFETRAYRGVHSAIQQIVQQVVESGAQTRAAA